MCLKLCLLYGLLFLARPEVGKPTCLVAHLLLLAGDREVILIAGLRLQIGTHLSVFSVVDVLQAGIEFILDALVVFRAILTR